MATDADDFDLERTLPYLLNRAGVRIGAAFTGDLKAYRLTLPMWRVLASLHHASGQSVTELAEHTSIELSTVSRLVSTGVRRGWLKRRAGDDARTLRIDLAPSGRHLALRIVPLARLYELVALAGFTAEEIATLKRLLARVYVNIAGLGAEPAKRSRTGRSLAHVERGRPRA
jgi:DNA-binding MarR family transcriptional regulator